jgi:protein-tyrosine phosphatase
MAVRILTVCLGNICRSPAAAAVIRAWAESQGVDVEVDSAGTASYHVGEPPHPQSVAAGSRRRYVVTGSGRQLTADDFRTFDLIVTMDGVNLRAVHRLAPPDGVAEVVPLRTFDPDAAGDLDVPDPWGEPDAAYDHMYDLIERSVPGLIDYLGESARPRRRNPPPYD